MRFSFWRMLSTSSSGGRCSRSCLALGFLISRLTETRVPFSSYFKTSWALTFQALSVFLALVPPLQAWREFLELHGLGFGVVLPAFGQRLLVVPDVLGRAGAVEEEEIGGDRRVWGEDAVWQADDRVEVEFLEEFLFDAGADAVAEEDAVRARPCRSGRLLSRRRAGGVCA